MEYIRARASQLKFYRKIPLFCNTEEGKFVLYKPVGITLEDMRINEGLMPSKLYINQDDKLKGIQESQERFNLQLKKDIQSNQPDKVKETIINSTF